MAVSWLGGMPPLRLPALGLPTLGPPLLDLRALGCSLSQGLPALNMRVGILGGAAGTVGAVVAVFGVAIARRRRMEQQKQQEKQQALKQERLAKGRPDANAADALRLLAFGIDVVRFLLKEPLLLAALWFSSLGAATLAIQVCWTYPWLPLFGVGAACLLARAAQVVEFQGLLSLLPRSVAFALQRPLYELLSEALSRGAVVSCNVLRLGMLAVMELREEQRRELLSSMDPAFRDFVFRQPSGLLLPWPLRRALLGRDADSLRPGSGFEAAAAADPAVFAPRRQRSRSSQGSRSQDGAGAGSAAGGAPEADAGLEAADGEWTSTTGTPVTSTESLSEFVRGVGEVAHNSKASAEFASLERILAQKMVTGSTALVARNLVSTTQAQVGDVLEYGKAKASEAVEGVREAAADPRTRATAVGGAVALGAGGGATGLVSGGAIGAALGVVPAIFTFGLSIPVGAAIGSGVGLAAGAVGAGVTGFLGGGALGWNVYGRKRGEQAGAVEDRREEHAGAVAVRGRRGWNLSSAGVWEQAGAVEDRSNEGDVSETAVPEG